MEKEVLISGAGFAGLALAYWLNQFGYRVTVVELSSELRMNGAPIDVRGAALNIAEEMGILDKIKAMGISQTNDTDIVNAVNETILSFSLNSRPEYLGDIEIYREDLMHILYEQIPNGEVEFLWGNSIQELVQQKDCVTIEFRNGARRDFDFVFGADGTHSTVRKLVFGEEQNYSRFFGEYFAFADASSLDNKPGKRVMYNEPGKMAVLFPVKDKTMAGIVFRSSRLEWDYRNHSQIKQILKEKLAGSSWRIPEILELMLRSDNLYFDEVCQIHMPGWTAGRVALVGDAAHAASFHTGMGTSLALQGAAVLAKQLHTNNDYNVAFANYNEIFRPYVESVQAKITQGMNYLVPGTEEDIQKAYERWRKNVDR